MVSDVINDSAPWASGPAELLEHAIGLLQEESDAKRRIAMILIDNSVELIIKTYLGLPKRVTGIHIGRKKLQEISDSFPSLLDALEEHAPDKTASVDFGVIEWFHTIRNQLYHQGNGITVERQKVDAYAELARQLFEALFEEEFSVSAGEEINLLGHFMDKWVMFEKEMLEAVSTLGEPDLRITPRKAAALLHQEGVFDDEQLSAIAGLTKLRNRVVHGEGNYHQELQETHIEEIDEFREKLRQFRSDS